MSEAKIPTIPPLPPLLVRSLTEDKWISAYFYMIEKGLSKVHVCTFRKWEFYLEKIDTRVYKQTCMFGKLVNGEQVDEQEYLDQLRLRKCKCE